MKQCVIYLLKRKKKKKVKGDIWMYGLNLKKAYPITEDNDMGIYQWLENDCVSSPYGFHELKQAHHYEVVLNLWITLIWTGSN